MNLKSKIGVIVGGLLLAFVFLPLLYQVSAQGTPQDCCYIKYDMGTLKNVRYKTSSNGNWTRGDVTVQAGDVVQSGAPGAVCDLNPSSGHNTYIMEEWGLVCMLNTIATATNWIFYFLTAIAVIIIILGGVTIMTAGGSTERVAAGKKYIIYALAGLAIALIAKAIPPIVKAMMGV